MATYEPLHHKYRPQIFADLVGQGAIADTLTNAINRQRIAPAYLFTGPRGTGKTSSARILAKSLNCLSSDQPTPIPCGQCEVCKAIAVGSALDVIEIDAASNTGVDNIREIIERAQFAPVQCRYKVYVIDECHMLSVAAFNALLKTLEEPPDRVIFVLATTDPQRVLPTIISRCQRFDYRRIPLGEMVQHLEMIAQKEVIDITSEAITLVGQIANGGLRDAESLLDQLSLLSDTITPEKVWDLVGAVPEQDLLKLIQAIQSDQAEAVLEHCRHLMNRGREPLVVLQNLAGFYLNLLIAQTAPNRSDMVAVTAPTWEALCTEAKNWSKDNILRGQKHLKDSEVQLKNTTQPRLWLEVTLLGLLPSSHTSQTVVVASPTATATATPTVNRQPVAVTPVKPSVSPSPPVESAKREVESGKREEVNSPPPPATNDLNGIWQAFLGYLSPM
ncbi:MAG: DNA polymerase III subunit gamma/tau, partial [Microcystaceae cyanobacterium]